MKRKALLQRLKALGLTIEEGGEHTRVLKDGVLLTTVPRHTELNEITAKNILKAAGLK